MSTEIEALIARLRKYTGTGFVVDDAQSAADALAAQAERIAALEARDKGPGSPSARLCYLLNELDTRFPGAADKYSSEPAEPKLISALDERIAELERDAGRWRAFINCARIRLFGWAGYGSTKGGQVHEPDSNGYRHFGGEFWTIYDAPSDPLAQEILTGFADAAVAIAAQAGSKEKS